MEMINAVLSGYVMPLLLMGAGIFFMIKLRLFYILHPIRTLKTLAKGGREGGVSPFRALSQALAGTLGVGNMTGVATAICSGGAGAVFWMWASAILAMSVKYFEVALAVKQRRKGADGYYGGAMYYIKDVFSPLFPKGAGVLGGLFAVLCMANSLLTGNVVQMNSAAAALPFVDPLVTGFVTALLCIPVITGKGKKISAVTAGLIPFLSALYVVLSLIIIIPSAEHIPSVMNEIFRGAFSFRAVGGGMGGYLIARAIRFGATRGIFSNEAGCGTSPTAHAQANAKSPHAQGCFGIFEVFADTIILCSLTAFVILLSDGTQQGLSGIGLTVYAFSSLAGKGAGLAVSISVVLFAYATVICQADYGRAALTSITKSQTAKNLYMILTLCATVAGTVIPESAMWQGADFIISLMTALNVLCLLYANRRGMLNFICEKKDIPSKKLPPSNC